MRRLKRIAISLGINFVILILVAAALTAFSRPGQPLPLHSVTDPFANMDLGGLPSLQRYRARDGALLSYRAYAAHGPAAGTAVLVHGSAGSSADMHVLAQALQSAGITVFVPDLRGHGANLPHGDIAYDGQLDDDMADFVSALKSSAPPRAWTLLGFSSGGGFALRIAGGSLGQQFDRYILLSPYLRYNAPTVRPPSQTTGHGGNQAWYSVATPRIVGLSILSFFGISQFNGLPVIAFPVPTHIEGATASYSFRLQNNFEPHSDYRADIRRASRPMQMFVGSEDELFLPNQFAKVFGAERKDIPVTILPGLDHSDMITKPIAIQAVVEALQHPPSGAIQ